ncbi:M24 family metallopeptidase [Sphingomicrobium sediminis]|uniref:Xaa-Pro peptidase family protein n=1 Tax=Sphingomicrobium sediminis TaxID=2950949 RepID=A0A9X2EG75_9SPHN|nr:Xaa-Pro peptidase family protein [Sphingomicrobium sediminis]MCM8556940.1 Xaa-Pro peptidase family protein [Sphingomicrobium sediminis]
MKIDRRELIAGSAALGVAGLAGAAGAAVTKQPVLTDIVIPPAITPEERGLRIAKAQRLMRDHGIGAILVESGPSLDYFTGVQWGRSERLTGALIPAEGKPIIVTPFFEKPSVAETLAVDAEIRTWHEHVEPLSVVVGYLRELGLEGEKIGMEETNRYFLVDKLQSELRGARVVSANPVVRGCRMYKSDNELRLMRAANHITLTAIGNVIDRMEPGMTGRDVRAMLTSEQVRLGGSRPWALVLFGPDAALPHGTGREQVLGQGDIVLVDTGCSVHGYQSDISRTWVLGTPSAQQRRVWDQVAAGQQVAWKALKIGQSAGSVDDAVRAAYESWGYGPDYELPGLSHRTGHGIGMQGHEPVNLVRGETEKLAPGMCFSNEPGIYLPGKFGVRLEDCFYMGETGPKWFTVPPTSLDDPLGRMGDPV